MGVRLLLQAACTLIPRVVGIEIYMLRRDIGTHRSKQSIWSAVDLTVLEELEPRIADLEKRLHGLGRLADSRLQLSEASKIKDLKCYALRNTVTGLGSLGFFDGSAIWQKHIQNSISDTPKPEAPKSWRHPCLLMFALLELSPRKPFKAQGPYKATAARASTKRRRWPHFLLLNSRRGM